MDSSSEELSMDVMDDKSIKQSLYREVQRYFIHNKLSKHAPIAVRMYSVIVALGIIGLYSFLLLAHVWLIYKLVALIALALLSASLSLGMGHTSNHYCFAKNRWVNLLLGAEVDLLGGSAFLWRFTHNVLHHSHVNVNAKDMDIEKEPYFRFSPHQPLKAYHRYQHIYCWFLYGLLLIKWWVGDFKLLFSIYFQGNPRHCKLLSGIDWLQYVIGKIVFVLIFFVVPFFCWSLVSVLLFAFLVSVVFSLVLSVVFQVAHVTTDAQFLDSPTTSGADRMLQQILASKNFSSQSKLVCYYLGGLNTQIEHHLFPTINFGHYPNLVDIVRDYCQKNNIVYLEKRSFMDAIKDHYHHLKHMGSQQVICQLDVA